MPQYDRGEWKHWIDEDGDCRDTRAEILERDNVYLLEWRTIKSCVVKSGKWVCPYTGESFTLASDVDIDHVVPLAHAHNHGGAYWSAEKKRKFANDPLNLLVVDDTTNRKKGARGPDKWKPPETLSWSAYAARWTKVKDKYGLIYGVAERWALDVMLAEE
jgi:hypothetical protein